MKLRIKLPVALLCSFLFLSALQAQIGLGIRGGINIATAELEDKVNDSWDTEMQEYMITGTAGIVAAFQLSDKFAIQPELYYIQKGYKSEITVLNETVDFKSTLNYIELPLLFKGRFGPGPLKFNAMLGPSFGYGFNGKSKAGSIESEVDFDNDNVSRWDIGGILSLGASLEAGPGDLFLDARLGWGFSNLDNSSNSDKHNWHNRGYNIGLGYMIYF